MNSVAIGMDKRSFPRTKKRIRADRIVPIIHEPILKPKTLLMDRLHPLWTLGLLIVLSTGLHVIVNSLLYPIQDNGKFKPRSEKIEFSVIDKPKPPPPPPPPPVKPKPKKIVKPKPVIKKKQQQPLPKSPEPKSEPISEPATPFFVAGLSLSSTTSVKVQPTKETSNDSPRNYNGEKFVERYKVTSDPVYLDNVTNAQLKSFYPAQAQKEEYEGIVEMELTVDFDGSVTDVKILTDPGHGFADAAIKVAYLFKYKPALENGIPVATNVVRFLRFEIK